MGLSWSAPKKIKDDTEIICITELANLSPHGWHVYKTYKTLLKDDGFEVTKDAKSKKWFCTYTTVIVPDSEKPVNYKDPEGNITKMYLWEAQRSEKINKWKIYVSRVEKALADLDTLLKPANKPNKSALIDEYISSQSQPAQQPASQNSQNKFRQQKPKPSDFT
jgi:hypothetical protein